MFEFTSSIRSGVVSLSSEAATLVRICFFRSKQHWATLPYTRATLSAEIVNAHLDGGGDPDYNAETITAWRHVQLLFG